MKSATELLRVKGTLKSVLRVQEYLEEYIARPEGEMLAGKITESQKSMEDVWNYILFMAKKEATSCDGGKSCVIDDETVFGWAVQYYEDVQSCELLMHPPKAEKPKEEKKAEKKTRKKKETESPEAGKTSVQADSEKEITQPLSDKTEDPLEGFIPLPEDDDTFEPDILAGQVGLSELISGLDPYPDEKSEEIKPEVCKAEAAQPEIKAQKTQTKVTPAGEAKEEKEETPEDAEEPKVIPFPGAYDPGEEKCIVCGKAMRETFPDTPKDTLSKWVESWKKTYGGVFCCKAHKESFLGAAK